MSGLLDAAAAALAPRELVSDAGFSLLGAMSSLQVGDAKMDLGLRPARTAADRIRAGKAPLRLRLAQCLDVCDRLLRRYATWLAGHTLAQTVFDCLYLQKEGKKSWCSHLEGGGSGGRNRPPPVPLSRPPPSPSPPIFQLSLPVGLPK